LFPSSLGFGLNFEEAKRLQQGQVRDQLLQSNRDKKKKKKKKKKTKKKRTESDGERT